MVPITRMAVVAFVSMMCFSHWNQNTQITYFSGHLIKNKKFARMPQPRRARFRRRGDDDDPMARMTPRKHNNIIVSFECSFTSMIVGHRLQEQIINHSCLIEYISIRSLEEVVLLCRRPRLHIWTPRCLYSLKSKASDFVWRNYSLFLRTHIIN